MVNKRLFLDRRDFLKAAGLSFTAALLPGQMQALDRADAVYCSAFMAADGSFGVATVADNGAVVDRIGLSDRGHDITQCPVTRRCVAFARRPGTFALVFDPATAKPIVTLTSPPDRHYFGHGVFSNDGKLLYATENDFDNYRGVIGIYNAAANFERIGEFPSFGIDPHDMALIEDGKVLVVANGGIKTHPSHGRDKLNLDHMEPSLVFIDTAHGSLLEKHDLPDNLRQLSTRHMDISSTGDVWIGCQFEGAKNTLPPLVARLKRGDGLTFVDLPEDALKGLSHYVGSVAANRDKGLIAVSSPKGGTVLTFDDRTGALLKTVQLEGVCGIAQRADGFVLSSETGLFGETPSDTPWDNHILTLQTI